MILITDSRDSPYIPLTRTNGVILIYPEPIIWWGLAPVIGIYKKKHWCPMNSDDGFVQIFSVYPKAAKAAREFKEEHDSSRNPSV